MPTFFQKIRLVLRGWSRRRAEREKEFLAKNVWGPASAAPGAGRLKPASEHVDYDMEGLVVAFLDDSGRIAYYLDRDSGEVIDVRDGTSLAPPRYQRVPARTEQSESADRRTFVASLDPSRTRDALARHLASHDEFRRALAADRALERAWFSFKNDRAIAAIQEWVRTL